MSIAGPGGGGAGQGVCVLLACTWWGRKVRHMLVLSRR